MPRGDKGFKKGNPGGPGNPQAASVLKLRGALLNAATEDDVIKSLKALRSIRDDKRVNAQVRVNATVALLDRLLGKAPQAIEINGSVEIKEVPTMDEMLSGYLDSKLPFNVWPPVIQIMARERKQVPLLE